MATSSVLVPIFDNEGNETAQQKVTYSYEPFFETGSRKPSYYVTLLEIGEACMDDIVATLDGLFDKYQIA